MTYSRLRDILNMLDKSELAQEASFLVNGKLERIDTIESFRGDASLAKQFGGDPSQIFLTNNKQI